MNKNKREILKGLAIGSAWATPVVSSVMLPVHANTSCIVCGESACNPDGLTPAGVEWARSEDGFCINAWDDICQCHYDRFVENGCSSEGISRCPGP